MAYPTLEQFNEALQHPAFALTDPVLKAGTVATTGLGLPLALCGGFALTYTITAAGKKYAVRCFHREAPSLETRYRAVSTRLDALASPYFVGFDFQPQGVRVGGRPFPVVKMAWASGATLGQFLETHRRQKAAIDQLRQSLRALAAYLEGQGIAHGDIQPGNVMVADEGRSVQLIDYDGMYVDELHPLGSAELGLRNFQHPGRTSSSWDGRLDRFSFITLELALQALAADPRLWARYQADENSLLFKANDFARPFEAPVFRDLLGRAELADAAHDFAAICVAPYDQTPTLVDYLARRNIPTVAIPSVTVAPAVPLYLSAFPVLAAEYARCLGHVGDRIELVGRVAEVKRGVARNGKPYVFINFGDWRGQIVKLTIWSEGLAAMATHRPESFEGKWISATGLLEPPYRNERYGYEHLSITVLQPSQIHTISGEEARFRLAGSSTRAAPLARVDNQGILDGMRHGSPGASAVRGRRATTAGAASPTPNAAILAAMTAGRRSTAPTPTARRNPPARPTTPAPSSPASDIPLRTRVAFAIGVVALIAIALNVLGVVR